MLERDGMSEAAHETAGHPAPVLAGMFHRWKFLRCAVLSFAQISNIARRFLKYG
jgi:hypothetical protein